MRYQWGGPWDISESYGIGLLKKLFKGVLLLPQSSSVAGDTAVLLITTRYVEAAQGRCGAERQKTRAWMVSWSHYTDHQLPNGGHFQMKKNKPWFMQSHAIPDSPTYIHITGSTYIILFQWWLKVPQILKKRFFLATVTYILAIYHARIIHSLEIGIKSIY